MTIEVIKRGTPPGEKKYEITCGKCTTKFSFQASDATRGGDQRDGDYLKVHCPVCEEACFKNL